MLVPLDKLSEAMEVFEKEIQVEKLTGMYKHFYPIYTEYFFFPSYHMKSFIDHSYQIHIFNYT